MMLSKSAYSAIKTLPKPKYISSIHIANTSAEKLVRFSFLLGLKITMLDQNNIETGISAMINNVIGHGKGLRKELINLASK